MSATCDLSIVIPARNEMFLQRTIADILAHIEANTEIIVILDGAWADPPIADHDRVTLVYHPESIGQRAATNEAVRLAQGKYIMKVDAHCAFDQGFDRKLLEAFAQVGDSVTMVPIMRNLRAFDWVCPAGHRRYQSPSGPCNICGAETTRDIVWIPKVSPQSTSYCFDATPHFQYFKEFAKRPEGQGMLTETMSLQGSCFMVSKDKYWELDLCDENFGSWGSQGIEVAVKTWLSGGRVLVNHATWYAHLFRTQGGDFSFPYHQSQKQVDHAKQTAKQLFFENKWSKQIHPLSWLVEKFWPVPGWSDEDLKKIKRFDDVQPVSSQPASLNLTGKEVLVYQAASKGIIFYTDNQLPLKIAHMVQFNLYHVAKRKHMSIVSSSLKKMAFGDKNIHFPSLKRGILTMFKQILAALENSTAEIIFFCEHDCLYPQKHFDFIPARKDTYYYNENFYKVGLKNNKAVHFDAQQLSGLCAYRELLLQHYKKRVAQVERDGFSRAMGFEPGTHGRGERVDDFKAESWKTAAPIIDIRHGNNLTADRWSPEEFRNKRYTKGWVETDIIPSWGKVEDLVKRLR